jgi:hypothetical protein
LKFDESDASRPIRFDTALYTLRPERALRRLRDL